MGLYPNAGQSYYLLHAPLIPEWTLLLQNGKILHGVIKGKGTHFEKVMLNGRLLSDARLEHTDLMQGGELVFYVSSRKTIKENKNTYSKEQNLPHVEKNIPIRGNKKASIAFVLNQQYRTWPLTYDWQGDTLLLTCKEALYKIPRSVMENGNGFCWEMPSADGAIYQTKGTFAFISQKALQQLLQEGYFVYDSITWRKIATTNDAITVRADIDQTEMTIALKNELPLVLEMKNNPLGINWYIAE